MVKWGINNNNLKQQNRGMILKLIATGECSSRIEIAKCSGLTKMSVTNIVSEFMELGIVEEQDVEPTGGQGRNPICITISQKAPKLIGLFIHRDSCTAVLCDLRLQIQKKAVVKITEENSGRLLEKMYEVIDAVMPAEDKVVGIGVGAVGPVDIRRGMILNPPNFFGIRDFEVTAPLYERYRLPVYLDSQYNCAALAEKYFGIGKRYHDFVFLGITNGIGSGIICDDRIFRNSHGLTSEIGHISIDWKGERCSCGNRGCLEMYAGARVIEKVLCECTGERKSFREFCWKADELGERGDAIFRKMMDSIACALTSLVNLMNPQAVIVGHEGFWLPDVWLKYLEKEINKMQLSRDYRSIVIRKSSFEEEAHLRGCVCTVLNKVFEGEITVGDNAAL